MTRYAMVIDVTRCTGCHNCFLACRDEHAGNDHLPVAAAQPELGHRWIDVQEHERGAFPKVKVSYVPVPCQQCAEAPCLAAGEGGAVYRRADGIVVIDPDRAVGQRDIVEACPYGAVFWNEAKRLPQKCTFCAHLLDAGWRQPRCAEACPTRAIAFGDLDEPAPSGWSAQGAVEPLHPEHGTRPVVGYIGLPKRFIAGEIVLADKMEWPAPGVAVSLRHDGQHIAATTDDYGDFEFDGLQANAEYVLSVSHPGYHPRSLTLVTQRDLNVGTIALDPLGAETRRERTTSPTANV